MPASQSGVPVSRDLIAMLEVSQLRTPLIGPIDLAVGAGDCAAILGPSGSGKSLFLRALADLDPNEGIVRFEGRDRKNQSAPEWRRQVGLLPAESGWWADRVGDHFDHVGSGDLEPILAAIGMPGVLDWRVDRLSTGERHRLALARTLAMKPRALLLDEPTAALDEDSTVQVEDLLNAQRRAGVAIVLVTHQRAQADRFEARRYRMGEGRLSIEVENSV